MMCRCCLFVFTVLTAVVSTPIQNDWDSSPPFTSMFYLLDARGDIIVSNSSTRSLKYITMGIRPHSQQHITVVGCATKSNTWYAVEADIEAVFPGDGGEETGNGLKPCSDIWKDIGQSTAYGNDSIPIHAHSVECGTIFEKNFSPEGIFWKGSVSGLMTVSSGKVDENGPISVVWSVKEDDDDGGGCAEAKIFFEPVDEAMTLFEVDFLLGRQTRTMRVAVLGDSEAGVVEDGDSGSDRKDLVISLLASALGIIALAAVLWALKEQICMCFILIAAQTCARRYPI